MQAKDVTLVLHIEQLAESNVDTKDVSNRTRCSE
jgi:hypothetical protein